MIKKINKNKIGNWIKMKGLIIITLKWDQIENSPSEAFFERVLERGSLWSLTVKREEEEDLSLPPLIVLEVDGEDRSSCLSRTSLIRFRSTDATSALDPTPPLSLYIITTITIPYSLSLLLLLLWFFLFNHNDDDDFGWRS